MVNTKHDTASYENCSYKREIFNSNNLYDSFIKAKRGSDWKPQVQKYEMSFLSELAKLQKELEEKTFKLLPSSEFILNERGKTRLISGEQIHDRIAKGCLSDGELLPSIRKYLAYDNGASLKGKGIDFTRKRFDVHLRKYYQQNQSNDGYILLIDFTKYFDNIRHEDFINIFKKIGIDKNALWLLKKTVEKSRVDVSYMTDNEYLVCMDTVFNSLEYQQINKNTLMGEKFMGKHLNIGDQVAQVAGITYPMSIDNYIKIVKGVKFYGRYMDDSYIIHNDREYLKELLSEIIDVAKDIGITINANKTHIYKLSSYWKYLQIQYSLTDTGRIIKKINPKRLTTMRRKLKKLASVLPKKDFENLYNSWFNNHYKIMSKQQRQNINNLYDKLKEEYYVQD
jgi:DNA-binding transcriptional regulator YhcF (GntR family)